MLSYNKVLRSLLYIVIISRVGTVRLAVAYSVASLLEKILKVTSGMHERGVSTLIKDLLFKS